MSYSKPDTFNYTIRVSELAWALGRGGIGWERVAEIGEFEVPAGVGQLHLARGTGFVGSESAHRGLWVGGGQIFVAYDDVNLLVALVLPQGIQHTFRTRSDCLLGLRLGMVAGRLFDLDGFFDVRLIRFQAQRVGTDLKERGFAVRSINRGRS